MLDTRPAQNWALADRESFLSAVRDALSTEARVDDIWIVGSRIMGFHRAESDIDVIVWFNEYTRQETERDMDQFRFEGAPVKVAKRQYSDWADLVRSRLGFDGNPYNRAIGRDGTLYELPFYSLQDMALTDAPDQAQSDWLDYRVESIPGFLGGRDASGLTFTYVGENQTIVDWIG